MTDTNVNVVTGMEGLSSMYFTSGRMETLSAAYITSERFSTLHRLDGGQEESCVWTGYNIRLWTLDTDNFQPSWTPWNVSTTLPEPCHCNTDTTPWLFVYKKEVFWNRASPRARGGNWLAGRVVECVGERAQQPTVPSLSPPARFPLSAPTPSRCPQALPLPPPSPYPLYKLHNWLTQF